MRAVTACAAALVCGACATAGTNPPAIAAAQPALAFPGAEGAGAHALGGRGGRVLRVTSLADSGPGSLRAAVEAEGARTIVFDIGGTIALERPLRIRNGRISIAGQTAPGGGITLRGQPLLVQADDVVIRYIRARLGDETGVEADALSIERGRRIIVDHVSASWSVDETLSAGQPGTDPNGGVGDVTVQWSIISESLNGSGHAKGTHGYGSLVRAGFGQKLSFHHNLWAHHSARMPRPGNYNGPAIDPTGPLMEFRSNLFYNWGGTRSGYNADEATNIAYNFIDNAYVTGPNSTRPIAFQESNRLARAYFAGNSMNGTVPADPWSLVTGVAVAANRLAAPIDVAPVRADPAASAYRRILAGAGSSRSRDSVDRRVVESVVQRGGTIIDSQSEVGGWPELASGTPWRDGDGDGMPDDWERRRRLDPRDPADGNRDSDGDGYTNLEEWLAELAG
ncbi:pectate lyase family protein [Allosphingosinicella sp.]|uniref:pectate lyase family protein n=1 Tax=Allosphingosinicella sp. TaxID=2823234 RepID=UPI002F11B5FB